MAGQTPTNTSSGIAFLVSSGIVYEIVAAACSSPQTTEINASTRADTLMKWVHLGLAQAVVFVVAAAMIDRKHAAPILTGGAWPAPSSTFPTLTPGRPGWPATRKVPSPNAHPRHSHPLVGLPRRHLRIPKDQ